MREPCGFVEAGMDDHGRRKGPVCGEPGTQVVAWANHAVGIACERHGWQAISEEGRMRVLGVWPVGEDEDPVAVVERMMEKRALGDFSV